MMGFFDDWRKTPDPKKLAIEALLGIDRLDKEDLQRLAEELEAFASARDALCEVASTGWQLWLDAFFALEKFSPKVREGGEMRPKFLINHTVLQEMMKLPEYERLTEWTRGDLVTSAMALEGLEPELAALYDRARTFDDKAEELERLMEELAAALEGQQMFSDMAQEFLDGLDPADPEDQAQAEQLQEMMDQIAEDIEQMRQAAGAASEKLEDQATNAAQASLVGFRRAMTAAADAAEDLAANARAWGMEAGVLQKLDAAERIRLAERFSNPKFDGYAEMIGPMTQVAMTEQSRKVYTIPEEVYDVGMGNDLSRVLPSELLMLAHPLSALDFTRKWVDGELLEYKMRGTEKVGKGGIYLLMDNSGSMGGIRERLAKAVGLATLRIARDQKREFYGIHFASSWEIETYDFRDADSITIDRVLDYAEHFFGGGTDFETPLRAAVELLQDEFNRNGVVSGDILFITDDDCGVSEEFLAEFAAAKDRLGFRVWGIAIGARTTVIEKFCDDVRVITDMASPEQFRDMFREL